MNWLFNTTPLSINMYYVVECAIPILINILLPFHCSSPARSCRHSGRRSAGHHLGLCLQTDRQRRSRLSATARMHARRLHHRVHQILSAPCHRRRCRRRRVERRRISGATLRRHRGEWPVAGRRCGRVHRTPNCRVPWAERPQR